MEKTDLWMKKKKQKKFVIVSVQRQDGKNNVCALTYDVRWNHSKTQIYKFATKKVTMIGNSHATKEEHLWVITTKPCSDKLPGKVWWAYSMESSEICWRCSKRWELFVETEEEVLLCIESRILPVNRRVWMVGSIVVITEHWFYSIQVVNNNSLTIILSLAKHCATWNYSLSFRQKIKFLDSNLFQGNIILEYCLKILCMSPTCIILSEIVWIN